MGVADRVGIIHHPIRGANGKHSSAVDSPG